MEFSPMSIDAVLISGALIRKDERAIFKLSMLVFCRLPSVCVHKIPLVLSLKQKKMKPNKLAEALLYAPLSAPAFESTFKTSIF